MMDDYITKGQALYIASYAANTGNIEQARKLLDVAPTANVAPVVYCADCKYVMGGNCCYVNGECQYQHLACQLLRINISNPETFYCAMGEKK